MRREEAKREIERIYQYEYLRLSGAVVASESSTGGWPFYRWLCENRPDLLEFRSSGPKGPLIAGWAVEIRIPPKPQK